MPEPLIREIQPSVHLAFGPLDQFQGPLLGSEQDLMRDVTATRMREQRGGRTAARLALRMTGISEWPVLSGADGEPIWPPNVCGSLAHTRSHIGAVAAPRGKYQSLGLDIEDERPFGSLKGRVASPSEEEECLRASAGLNAPPANVAFCAKEAFFKCQFYVARNRELDFEDIVLKQTGSNRLGVKSAPRDLGNFLLETSVYLYRIDGQLVALAMLATDNV